MRFCIEDHPIEVERARRREEEIEIFERLGEEKALHRVVLLFRLDILQRRIAILSSAVLHKIAPETFAHIPVLLILRVAVKVISRLDDLRSQRITRRRNLLRAVIKLLRLNAYEPPHPVRRILQQLRALQIATERQHRRKERVERAVSRRAPRTGVHVSMTVPKLHLIFATYLVREILINRRDALVPHPFAVSIAKQQRALQQVLVITIDRAADVAVSIRPLACLDIDPLAHQPDLRAAVVRFDERALRLLEKYRFAGELAQRPKLEDQRASFRG